MAGQERTSDRIINMKAYHFPASLNVTKGESTCMSGLGAVQSILSTDAFFVGFYPRGTFWKGDGA